MSQTKKKLSRDQVEYFTNLFMEFDSDYSGSISTVELSHVLKACGLNIDEEQVEDLINEVDADGSGEIEIDEFLALIEKELFGQEWSQEDFQASFSLFDADNHGTISAKELKKVLENLGETVTDFEVEEMIKFADKDSDGLITFEEFCEVMK